MIRWLSRMSDASLAGSIRSANSGAAKNVGRLRSSPMTLVNSSLRTGFGAAPFIGPRTDSSLQRVKKKRGDIRDMDPGHPLLTGSEFPSQPRLENGFQQWNGSTILSENKGDSDGDVSDTRGFGFQALGLPNGCDFGEEAVRGWLSSTRSRFLHHGHRRSPAPEALTRTAGLFRACPIASTIHRVPSMRLRRILSRFSFVQSPRMDSPAR